MVKLSLYILLVFVCLSRLQAASIDFKNIKEYSILDGHQIMVTPGEKGTVFVFLSSVCPCSNSHLPEVKRLVEDFKQFKFIGIHSNQDETLDEAKSYFQKKALNFPIIQDKQAKLANQFKALKTPHAFVVGKNGGVLFLGGISSSSVFRPTNQNYLRQALKDLVAGRDVRVTNSRPLGCTIER